MALLQKFLIVDHNPEGRFLLTKSLVRRFPMAVALECTTAECVIEAVKSERVELVIIHHTGDVSGAELIREIRSLKPHLPILAVSGDTSRGPALIAAGANRFMNFDEWLLIGGVVSEMLTPQAPPPEAAEMAPASA